MATPLLAITAIDSCQMMVIAFADIVLPY